MRKANFMKIVRWNLRLSVVFTVLLFSLLMLQHVGFVKAEQCIPIEGLKWPKNYVGVYVAGGVGDAQRKQVLFALNVWYSAEKWFIDSFEGGRGTPYLLYLADQPGDNTITVSFFIGQNEPFAGRWLGGVYVTPSNTYVRGDIQINLPPDHAANPDDLEVESIILHELGHALGLGHSDIKEDAMYPIDNYPQSYGLPSTLDLLAVYQLSQSGNPADLGGSVCLTGSIPYGRPPWVQQNQNGQFTITFPIGPFDSSYVYEIAYIPTLTVGDTETYTVTLKCTGNLPMKLEVASAQTDFGQTLTPGESFPFVVDPGQSHSLTYQFATSAIGLGKHTINFRVGFRVLTTSGWAADLRYGSFSSSFQVNERPPPPTTSNPIIVFTQPTNQNQPVLSTPTTPSQPSYTLGPFLVVAALATIIIASIIVYPHLSEQKQRNGVRPPKRRRRTFCLNCGVELPARSNFCHKCGAAQT